jgi:hypothetical protein
MILWLWGSLSGDFDHFGGLANVRNLIDKRKQKLSFLSIFYFSLVYVLANYKPAYKNEYSIVNEELRSC